MNCMITDSIGISLYNIYCGMEAILEMIAMDIDNENPDDENFSKELLKQMSLPTKDRLAVINVTPGFKDFMNFPTCI